MSPDALGRPYLRALARAREQGEAPVRIRLTCPVRPCAGEGTLRVVAVRPGPEWVLAYEGARRLPRLLKTP